MGFININGQPVHTSNINTSIGVTTSNITISGGSNIYTTTTSSGNFAIYSQKAKYNILGEEFEFDGYQDPTVGVIISCINIMGKPYYDELGKQGVNLPDEIKDFLELKFRILEREKKIDDVIGK